MDGQDPAPVIRNAVAKALVHYFPLAGRLRELEGRKLAVDCTGEGVPFVEADADVRLEHFGDTVHPPLPCLDELLFDVPGLSAILNSPPVLIQVTRLACGGFIIAVRIHHAMADGQGMLQFLEAVAEMARGAAVPTVQPVWERDLLMARNPPRPSFAHREYDEGLPNPKATIVPLDAMVQCAFFFRPQDVAAIKAHLPPHLQMSSTTFEVLTGLMWKCRTMALALDADEEVRVCLPVSIRGGKTGFRIPKGYYGNSIATPVAISTAGKLCANPIGYAVELVQKAKREVDAEYVQSVADHMVLRGRPEVSTVRLYLVSDLTKIRFGDLDYGWDRPVYGGPASHGPIAGSFSFLSAMKNAKGEEGIVVPMWLPDSAMEKFAEEVGKLLRPAIDGRLPQQHDVLPARKTKL
ncbi:Benzyl alcohol O-benzoyltransferase [Dichanthelium oligosanthes]|uniref:Benzyl alcohol O-benzoyltransferase n=1 Tax=Dichanthelium oligosanthes TaxID=888268 RepID=A0A1E5VYC0_9POAL|nr:Benzyl alcohol O-benzoyltransferase [Dichanthelium oligosanthes]